MQVADSFIPAFLGLTKSFDGLGELILYPGDLLLGNPYCVVDLFLWFIESCSWTTVDCSAV